MTYGALPWANVPLAEVAARVVAGETLISWLRPDVNGELHDIMALTWTYDPQLRPRMADVHAMLLSLENRLKAQACAWVVFVLAKLPRSGLLTIVLPACVVPPAQFGAAS